MSNRKENNHFKLHINHILVAILGFMFFCSIVTINFGADRFIGIADDGLYLLAARYPNEVQQSVSSVYIYTGYLFQVVNFNPIMFRLFGVILVCLSAVIFWLGFCKIVFELSPKAQTIKYFRLCSLFFIELGALLYYQWFYMTPNYNMLIGIAINISAGSVLYGYAQVENWNKNIKTIIPAFILAGLSIGMAIFVKFPAGICFLLLYFATIILWRKIGLFRKAILFAAVLTGIATWFFLHFLFVQSPQTWWQMFKEGWGLYQTLRRYTPQSEEIAYVKDFFFFVFSSIKIYWPSYLIICTVYPFYILRKNSRKLSETENGVIIFIVMLIAAVLSVKPGLYINERSAIRGSIPFYLLFHLAWILLLLTVWGFNYWYKLSRRSAVSRQKNINTNTIVILGLLIALPIAGSLGTANPLYNVTLCHAATWFGVILLLLVFFTGSERDNFRLRWFGILSIGVFTVSQIIRGYIFDPQGSWTNLLHQSEVTAVGSPAVNMKLDPEMHKLVGDLSSIARENGFKPGGDIIAISYLPGLVYAMGGKSPGYTTFLANSKQNEDYSRIALQYASIERLRNSFVLLSLRPEVVESLLWDRGLDFPDGYKRLGIVIVHGAAFSLWKPVQ